MPLKRISFILLFIACASPTKVIPLDRLMQINNKIFSGSEPKNAQSFSQLKDLGIKTIVSVDGLLPDTHLAQKYAMSYIHIPVGYDGITRQDQLKIKQVLKQMPPPYYIHCHHGIHRGPTAAAIMQLILGADKQQALSTLQKAGTSENYPGLWETIKNFKEIREEKLPAIQAQSKTSPLTTAMVQIDRAYDQLKLEFTPHSKLLLKEGFIESIRALQESELSMKGDMQNSLNEIKEMSASNHFNSLKILKKPRLPQKTSRLRVLWG